MNTGKPPCGLHYTVRGKDKGKKLIKGIKSGKDTILRLNFFKLKVTFTSLCVCFEGFFMTNSSTESFNG